MSQRADSTGPGDRAWRPAFDAALRIGDAERNEVVDALGQHYSAGRIDDTEFKERIDRASRAKTGADLDGIVSDLPPLRPPGPPVPARPRRSGLWVALAVVVVTLSVPWHVGPWGWWFPHPPWILAALVVFLVWRRARRRHWRAAPPPTPERAGRPS